MLGSLILYLKGMMIMMFQLSDFYCRRPPRPGADGAGRPSPEMGVFLNLVRGACIKDPAMEGLAGGSILGSFVCILGAAHMLD